MAQPAGEKELLNENAGADLAQRGPALVQQLEEFIARYLILPLGVPLVLSLWVVATWLAETFDAFPYLCFSSPLPRCGKTRAVEALELLVRQPWRGTTPSEAGLFRYLASCPTLLLDEVEGLSARRRSERDQAIISILNAGYRKGATVLRWDAVSRLAEKIPVYGPKAFCAIGNLPPTLADRSIIIPMQRRRADERVGRFRFARAKAEASRIHAEIEKQAKACTNGVAAVYADLPSLDFLSDRDEELFAPLFAVCSVFDPARLAELEESAKKLCGAKAGDADDDSLALRLLADLRRLWPEGSDAWPTGEMLSALKADADSPWSGAFELNPRRLARMLRPFNVFARNVRTSAGINKGYVLGEVKGAHSRYITPESATSATERINSGEG